MAVLLAAAELRGEETNLVARLKEFIRADYAFQREVILAPENVRLSRENEKLITEKRTQRDSKLLTLVQAAKASGLSWADQLLDREKVSDYAACQKLSTYLKKKHGLELLIDIFPVRNRVKQPLVAGRCFRSYVLLATAQKTAKRFSFGREAIEFEEWDSPEVIIDGWYYYLLGIKPTYQAHLPKIVVVCHKRMEEYPKKLKSIPAVDLEAYYRRYVRPKLESGDASAGKLSAGTILGLKAYAGVDSRTEEQSHLQFSLCRAVSLLQDDADGEFKFSLLLGGSDLLSYLTLQLRSVLFSAIYSPPSSQSYGTLLSMGDSSWTKHTPYPLSSQGIPFFSGIVDSLLRVSNENREQFPTLPQKSQPAQIAARLWMMSSTDLQKMALMWRRLIKARQLAGTTRRIPGLVEKDKLLPYVPKFCKAAVSLAPYDSTVLFGAGDTLRIFGYYADAEKVFRNLVSNRKASTHDYSLGMNRLALTLLAQGKMDEGIGWLRKRMVLFPKEVKEEYKILGDYHVICKEKEKAIAMYRKFLGLAPKHVWAAHARENLKNLEVGKPAKPDPDVFRKLVKELR